MTATPEQAYLQAFFDFTASSIKPPTVAVKIIERMFFSLTLRHSLMAW
jgi:hypothetical protein